jgi:hypothetical protein
MTKADLIEYMRRGRSATDEEVALFEALIDAMDRIGQVSDIMDRIDREHERLEALRPDDVGSA